jgi:hypothetical protein
MGHFAGGNLPQNGKKQNLKTCIFELQTCRLLTFVKIIIINELSFKIYLTYFMF